MKSVIINLLVFIFWNSIYSQTCNLLSDDYSNPSLWTKYSATGSNEIFIGNGKLNYLNSIDGKDERVYRTLPKRLNAYDDWEIEIDFHPIKGGINNFSGHEIVALTAGYLNPLSKCPNPKDCSGNWSPQNQDGIIIVYGTNHPPANISLNTFFSLQIKKGTGEIKSTNLIPAQAIYAGMGSVYHLNLIKCGNLIELYVSNNGIPLTGSPIVYQIPNNVQITGLNTIQHANSARGINQRIMTAQVDNLCVSTTVNNAPSISGVNFKNSTLYSTKFYTCEGNQCFYVYSKDPDNLQTLSLNVASPLPNGALFTQTPGTRPVGKICWNPGQNDIGVHTFQLEVIDDYCVPSSNIQSFTIEVLPGYNLGGPISICKNMAPLSLPDPGPGEWTINTQSGQTIVGNFLDPSLYSPGNYILTYCTPKPGSTSKCTGCWPIQLEILESPNIKFNFEVNFCDTDAPRILTATPGGGKWSGGPYINSNGLFDPRMASVNNGFGNPVTYKVFHPNGCFDSKTTNISVNENGLGMSYDLGTHCMDEFIVLDEGGYKYELTTVINVSPSSPPQNLPTLPYTLPGNTINQSHIANYIQFGNYLYFFKAWFKNKNGCEYYNEYVIQLTECSCSNEMAQNLSISATPNPNFLNYNFSFTPPFNSIPNIIRYKWVITDVVGNIIKTLNRWPNNIGNPGSSSFMYDFTPEFGTLFNCNNYHVFLQVISQSATGELSLCQDYATFPICDSTTAHFESGDIESNKLEKDVFASIKFFPTSCEKQSFLNFELKEERSCFIEIYNNLGRRILHIPERRYASGYNEVGIDCHELEKGICFIRLSDGLESKSIKFVVK